MTPFKSQPTRQEQESLQFYNTARLSFIVQKTNEKDKRRFWQDIAIFSGFAGDIVFFTLGMFLAYHLRFHTVVSQWCGTHHLSPPDYNRYIFIGEVLFAILSIASKTYRHDSIMRWQRIYWRLFHALGFWMGLFLLLGLTIKMEPALSITYVVLVGVSAAMLLVIWRSVLQRFFSFENVAFMLRQRILIIGWNEQADRLAKTVLDSPEHPFAIVGCLPAADEAYEMEPPEWVENLGSYDNLKTIISGGKIDIVLVADLNYETNKMIQLSQICEQNHVQFKVIPTYFQILLSGLVLESVSGIAVLGIQRLPITEIGNRMVRRFVDVIGASIGLLLSAPIIAWFALKIYMESPGPIFYTQTRLGRHERPFTLYKLRSMRVDGDNPNKFTQEADPRVLKVGQFIRRTNIDETPQFWNVLKGEMSLVGPRPERPSHVQRLEKEIPYYNARHKIKPGITGWAQIHGLRGNTDLKERIVYDLYYIENWNIWLDLYIMMMTMLNNKNAY